MDRAETLKTRARILLFAAALICGVGMMGPFQGIERVIVPWDKAAHFMAFYGLNLLLFTAFPNRRRLELTLAATLVGSGVEVVQLLSGRDAELGDLIADAAGAFAVFAPVFLEWARQPWVERRGTAANRAEANVLAKSA
jgi:VanZ family protein